MRNADKAAIVVAALLMAVAAVALWQSREFTPFAAIFPRTVGAALLLSCLFVAVRILRGRGRPATGMGGAGLLRSALLVLTMLGWIFVLESAGFLLASWAGFVVLALLANHDPLSPRRVAGFVGGALVCVLALQVLFQRGLDVKLPAGTWISGIF